MWFRCPGKLVESRGPKIESRGDNVHEVVLEKVLQLPLGGRIGEVSNVKSPTLCSTLDDSFILRSVDGLVTSSADGGTLGGGGWLREGSGCHLGGGTVDGSGGHD